MPDSADTIPPSSWPTSSGTVEEMKSGNLQFLGPNLVENMQSGGLQHQYAENMHSGGGLQLYDSYGDKERLPPPVQVEKIDSAPSTKQTIFGLSRRIFWLLAALFVLIIIGAVVGGVVGAQKRQSSTSAGPAGASAIPQASITSPITATSAASSSIAASSTGSVTTSSASATSANATTSSSTQAPTTTALPFITPARANPVDVDGNYFVNCNSTQSGLASGMAYYKNLVPGKNVGQGPDDYIDVTNSTYVTWENGGVGMPYHFMTAPASCALLILSS